MNTKIIMTASAIVLALAGVALTFMPVEITSYMNFGISKSSELVMQILALYTFHLPC